jgi:hypothetical protein
VAAFQRQAEREKPPLSATCEGGFSLPQKAWSKKRERQYEHIKESEKEQGKSEKTAKRIAAATVNKTRKEHGETKD